MAKVKKLSEVRVYGCVTHGSDNTVYDDDEIRNLVGKNAGAYGRHWVFGDRNGRRSIGLDDGDILVCYGTGEKDHMTFVGREALAQCLEFLDKFQR